MTTFLLINLSILDYFIFLFFSMLLDFFPLFTSIYIYIYKVISDDCIFHRIEDIWNLYHNYLCIKQYFFWFSAKILGNTHGIVANMQDYDIIEGDFKFQSHWCIHFLINTVWKGGNLTEVNLHYLGNSTSKALALNNSWRLIYH